MNSFEIWESISGYERALVPHDSPQHELLTTDEDGNRMNLVRVLTVETWQEALEEFRKHADEQKAESAVYPQGSEAL